jgi:cohesin complex subunit SA-1/2
MFVFLANEADDQLIEIMACSVKQAATGDPPVGRQSSKKLGTTASLAKDPRVIHEERTRITEAFIPTLPRLINKFIADQEKINSLTQLPLFFELEIYQVLIYDTLEISTVLGWTT